MSDRRRHFKLTHYRHHWRHHRLVVDVTVGSESSSVRVWAELATGCRTVGDLRHLLRLLGAEVAGEKRYDRSFHADAEYRAEQLFWGRADCLPLCDDEHP